MKKYELFGTLVLTDSIAFVLNGDERVTPTLAMLHDLLNDLVELAQIADEPPSIVKRKAQAIRAKLRGEGWRFVG